MRLARTPLAAAGVILTTACGLLFALALGADAYGLIQNPYVGIGIFGALPVGFVLGLLLIGVGNVLGRRAGVEGFVWPTINLANRGQRIFVMGLVIATGVNVVVLAVAGHGAVQYMETPAFCGEVCHTAMEPEFVGHAQGPHANVTCVSCHVGSGAGALVQSKIDGTRRLMGFISGNIVRPIATPVHDMRPARETCATCHWPEKLHGDKLKVITEYGDDEAVSETVTTLELKVGGGSQKLGIAKGIHWHMNIANEVEYIALDEKRQDIPYVKLTRADGTVREYRKPGVTDDVLAGGTRRIMDCTDCHSRPSHAFSATAERAADRAISGGQIPRALPFVRREVVKALKTDAPTKEAALAAIDRQLRQFYASPEVSDKAAPADVARAITAAQTVYASNVFPQMKVTWGSYTSELGHTESPGCFRCHDEEKVTPDGARMGQDCDTCHRMR